MRNSITYPLSVKQYEILGNLLKSESMYNVLNAGRQSGKTFLMSRLSLILAILKGNKDIKILVAAPYNTQVDTFFYNVMQIEGINDFIKKTIQSPYKSIIFKNGSIIDFRSADNPKSIRGKTYNYMFIDEFAFLKDRAFDMAIVPTLMASGDTCQLFFSSTPNGLTGMFHEMAHKGMLKLDNGEDNPDYDSNYSYNFMYYKANPNRNQKIIDLEELRQPPKRFAQEFLGEFVTDGGDVFENLEKICVLKSLINLEPGKRYYAGIDWGRAADKTVLTILDSNRQVVFMKAFEGAWNKQINDLGLILNEYKPVVYAESNGIGDPLLDQVKKVYKNVRPFLTTNATKKEMIENLRMVMIKEEIQLPSRKLNIDLFKELSNYTYSITKTGLISYHHREGGHDDYVDSLAMANSCYTKYNKEFKNLTYAKRNDFYG